jgi:hypothetical protein
MKEYHKIDSVFKRDPATKHKTFLIGHYSRPEFEYLRDNQWQFTEKVDGTNIRVMYADGRVTFGGRTDAASIPATLVDRLRERFDTPEQIERFKAVSEAGVCLYGEGYGARIQKGGGNYRQDQDFVLFDVLVGDFWLRRDDVVGVALKFGVDVVPLIGTGTLEQAIERTAAGFRSAWSGFDSGFLAEGIVARPAAELRCRDGSRIITKVKHKDFIG